MDLCYSSHCGILIKCVGKYSSLHIKTLRRNKIYCITKKKAEENVMIESISLWFNYSPKAS